ncbi:hypothetical protein ACIA5D_47310 [Actinoplanes sp. NPDC051513]|uniref:hypothetical protein n=1 Tax=Actinoplanes sp. NPDC051513 TaxID=3363908 RepID=UPI0037AB998D
MRRTTAIIMSAAVLGVLQTAGCGTTSTPAFCDSLSAVQLSAQHARETNVAENGLSQLRTNLNQLRTDVQQLITDAQGQWSEQAGQVRSNLDLLKASIEAARATPSDTNIGAVRSSLNTLMASVTDLGDAMRDTC